MVVPFPETGAAIYPLSVSGISWNVMLQRAWLQGRRFDFGQSRVV